MFVVGLERDGAHGFEIPSLDDCMEVVEGEVDIRSWDGEVLGYLAFASDVNPRETQGSMEGSKKTTGRSLDCGSGVVA